MSKWPPFGLSVDSMTCLFLLLCLLINTLTRVVGHIGEPCNSFLRICLPPSKLMFCDDDNICRCRPEYPVKTGAHSCKKAKKVGERCSHQSECTTFDPNSYCTQTPYSSECQCLSGFDYNYVKSQCVSENKKKDSRETLLLPSAVGFLLACFGLICCFVLIWHSFCRKRRSDDWSNRIDRTEGIRLEQGRERNPENNDIMEGSRLSRNSSHLPTYESALYDHPPPSYEEAIKGDLPSVSPSVPLSGPKVAS